MIMEQAQSIATGRTSIIYSNDISEDVKHLNGT